MTLAQESARQPLYLRFRPAHLLQLALVFSLYALCALLSGSSAFAQSAAQTAPGPSRPNQLPLSGLHIPPGTVTASGQPSGTSGNSTQGNSGDSINNSVTISAPFNGSVPTGTASGDILPLTLERALALGLHANLGIVSESAFVLQSKAQRKIAGSQLLPNLSSAISEQLERLNLRTEGVESSSFPEAVTFNFYDARAVRLQQTVLDLVETENLHSATQSLKASPKEAQSARDLVVLAVGGAYVQLMATKTRVSDAEAEVNTARAIYQQATDRHSFGLAARIDVTRSQVELQREEQRLRSLQADLETQSLRLARIIGLPLGQQFSAVDDFSYAPLGDVTIQSAMETAMHQRPDLQAASLAIKAGEDAVKAAHAERLPRIAITGDFGAAGITPTHESTGVYTAAAVLTVPIYQGGRIAGDVQQATAAVRQRKAEFEDLTGQVDQDVRQSFIDLHLAEDQIRLAKSNSDLARETLTQSRDRFSVGITDTVELVQAQQSVVQADDDYITAVFQHNLAKVVLARAMGDAEKMLPQLLRK